MIVLLVTTAIIVGTVAVGLAGAWKRRQLRVAASTNPPLSNDPFIPFLFDRPARWLGGEIASCDEIDCRLIQPLVACISSHNRQSSQRQSLTGKPERLSTPACYKEVD